MKILTDKKIKYLFGGILLCVLVFACISAVFLGLQWKHAALCIFLSALCMAFGILILCCRYFREQDQMLENAAAQITEYMTGNQNARIACDEEGELYKLFHKINALSAVLSAHIENESQSKAFLKDTISNISHQLKTPLAALNLYNGILQEEAQDLPTILEFTKRCEQELDRIETLVQNLLKITKLDAGTISLDKRSETVSELMNCVKNHFSFRAQQEGKEITLAGDDTVTLLCDRTWLLEAIDNIVKNALDHTSAGGHIRLEWKRLASVIQITVKDDGSGIHPEDLHHIFKRFYRSRFSKDTQGIGLGLPLAKTIIEAHNGTIEVSSVLGIGTTFLINFLIPTNL